MPPASVLEGSSDAAAVSEDSEAGCEETSDELDDVSEASFSLAAGSPPLQAARENSSTIDKRIEHTFFIVIFPFLSHPQEYRPMGYLIKNNGRLCDFLFEKMPFLLLSVFSIAVKLYYVKYLSFIFINVYFVWI